MERAKLDLQINSPINLQLLYDNPLIGSNKWGEFYCYSVKDENDKEYSFFVSDKVHQVLKEKNRGTRFQITKTAKQNGKKLVTDYEVNFPENGTSEEKNPEPKPAETGYFDLMLQSYEEATKIQSKYSAVNLNQCAVTLFIAKSRLNGFNNYPKE